MLQTGRTRTDSTSVAVTTTPHEPTCCCHTVSPGWGRHGLVVLGVSVKKSSYDGMEVLVRVTALAAHCCASVPRATVDDGKEEGKASVGVRAASVVLLAYSVKRGSSGIRATVPMVLDGVRVVWKEAHTGVLAVARDRDTHIDAESAVESRVVLINVTLRPATVQPLGMTNKPIEKSRNDEPSIDVLRVRSPAANWSHVVLLLVARIANGA